MNVVCHERVCYEQVCYERVCFERVLEWATDGIDSAEEEK